MSDSPGPRHQSHWHPTTKPGRLARIPLMVAAGTFILASVVSAIFGRRDSGTVDDVLRVTGPIIGVLFAVSGIAALVLAIRGLRAGDRSIPVWAALAMGSLVAIFLIGEILVPH